MQYFSLHSLKKYINFEFLSLQLAHGTLKGVSIDPYKNSSGEEIEIKETAKTSRYHGNK